MTGEGTHFKIPILQEAIVFDIKSRPRSVPVTTGSKDLQTVNLTLRILFHPDTTLLPSIYNNIGLDYDEKILPSIVNEVLKSVVVSSSSRFTENNTLKRPITFRLVKIQYFSPNILMSMITTPINTQAQYDASELITQREAVSQNVSDSLYSRAKTFGLELDDISITHLTFGAEFAQAVEYKQVAQQEAEKARFHVEKVHYFNNFISNGSGSQH